MTYKGVEITVTKSGKFSLISPVNGTLRIFNTMDLAVNYINKAEIIDSHAKALARNPW